MPILPAEVEAGGPLAEPLLAINNANAQDLSWLDAARLAHLVGEARVAWRIGAVEAFLLAFDRQAAYDSPNFRWVRDRYDNFLYVDRIVVAAAARGRGHARHLYAALFARALQRGHERILCEVNREPPNPVSDAFHAAMGFVEVGQASLHAGTKVVRYLARPVAPRDGCGDEQGRVTS